MLGRTKQGELKKNKLFFFEVIYALWCFGRFLGLGGGGGGGGEI